MELPLFNFRDDRIRRSQGMMYAPHVHTTEVSLKANCNVLFSLGNCRTTEAKSFVERDKREVIFRVFYYSCSQQKEVKKECVAISQECKITDIPLKATPSINHKTIFSGLIAKLDTFSSTLGNFEIILMSILILHDLDNSLMLLMKVGVDSIPG